MGNGNITVHTYGSPGMGSVNTHWIESPTAIVAIDGQRLVSQAQVVIEQMAAAGKPVEAMIITHIHPDHIGGTAAFVRAFPRIRVLASQAAIDGIRTDEAGLLALARQWLGADFQVATPNEVLVDNQPLSIAGMTFDVRQTGPGEASAMNVLYLRETKALFAADVVCNLMTPFLAEQRTGAWLKQLDWLTATFPEAARVYPGHGAPADVRTLVAGTREYLTRVRELVRSRQAGNPELTPQLRNELIAEVDRMYPGLVPVVAIPDAIGLNVDGVWAELKRER